ncbi:hypothetical protein Pmani_035165 [Petrolisthes manimaculis]|uniref:Uncharacterized protein n=1 Tax=Petrolisthes manimaculis TaxID=1843537 RepID=A0AAE1NL24_9EUCA|nr:hypothetical protein Pmani_035165 [Petrolisthes manimaculis]
MHGGCATCYQQMFFCFTDGDVTALQHQSMPLSTYDNIATPFVLSASLTDINITFTTTTTTTTTTTITANLVVTTTTTMHEPQQHLY